MCTLARRNSSIHRVREFALPNISLESEYEVLAILQEGWRGRLLLVEHKVTRNEVVLKASHKDATSRLEFFREFHYNYYLSPHRNILNAYDVAFQAEDYYIFAQEFAPFGDLTSNTSDTGIGEINTKKIACQLASALDFMHSKDLVHRDIHMDNVLVFKSDFSRVKLCDFGSTRKTNTLLKKKTVWLPYAPPEIVDAVQNEGYHVDTAQDVWQFGVMIYVLLTGMLPWQKADMTDPHYTEFINWRKRKTLRTPKRFSNFTARFLRLMKRTLEPKPEKRATVKEVLKYIDDKWLVRPVRRDDRDLDNQSVCYSTFSAHSSKLEKDVILKALKDHGIETTVDRVAKRKRIHDWLERSVNTKASQQVEVMEEERHGEDGRRESIPNNSNIGSSTSSTLTLKTVNMDPPSRYNLQNISSMNNIYDEGYHTASSNNSSIRNHHLQLAKSTGNINNLNQDRLAVSEAKTIQFSNQERMQSSEEKYPVWSNISSHQQQQFQSPVQRANMLLHKNIPNNSANSVVLPRASGVVQQSAMQVHHIPIHQHSQQQYIQTAHHKSQQSTHRAKSQSNISQINPRANMKESRKPDRKDFRDELSGESDGNNSETSVNSVIMKMNSVSSP